MSDLSNQTPADTYKGLLQVNDYTNGVDATAKYIQDGEGTDSVLALSTDKVGIGTTNPSNKLAIEADSTNFGISITNTGLNPARVTLTNNEGSGSIDANNGLLRLGNSSSEDLVIDSAGNVGIGTTNPADNIKLHIKHTESANFKLERNKVGHTNTQNGYVQIAAAESSNLIYSKDLDRNNKDLVIYAGNVGIGTTSPAAKLDIESDKTSGDLVKIDINPNSSGNPAGLHITNTNANMTDDAAYFKITDQGGNHKFRVNKNGNVGIGTTSPDAPLHILESGTADMLIIESTDSGALNSPDLTLYRNSATPLADDKLGVLKFSGNHSGGGTKLYAHIEGTIVDPTNTAEESKLTFEVRRAGAFEPRMEVGPDKVEVSSTTGGVIMPRMTTAQRNAIASPTNGEMVYDTDSNKFFGYANGVWTALH